MFVASGGRPYPTNPTPSFPLKVSGSGRYLVDQNNVPFPLIDLAMWGLPCVSSTSDMNQIISKLQTFGVTAVHVAFHTVGWAAPGNTNSVSGTMSGALPFTKNTSGATFTSTMQGQGDVSQYNTSYFADITTVINALQTAGIVAICHPAYLGFESSGTDTEGIATDMIASGSTKCQTYASYIASTFTQSNIIWSAYGDTDPRNTSGLDTVHVAYWTTHVANATQKLYCAQYFGNDGRPSAASNTNSTWTGLFPTTGGGSGANTLTGQILNSYYNTFCSGSDDHLSYATTLAGSQQSNPVVPTWCMDSNLYENDTLLPSIDCGPNGVRKRMWWQLLTGTCGVGWGNETTSVCGTTDGSQGSFTFANCNITSGGAGAGFPSDGHRHLGVAATIWKALNWWLFLPSNVGSMGTIITAGQGSVNGEGWITAAAARDGSQLVVYVPAAGNATFSVDMTLMGGTTTAQWVDPTTGAVSSAGSNLANTGSHSFTTPGNNAYGVADWVLVLNSTNRKVWI